MRSRPSKEELKEQFLEGATTNVVESKVISREQFMSWPLVNHESEPEFKDGSTLTRSMSLPLKEFEWNTIDDHIKKCGVSKTKWVKHAIYLLLKKEQDILNSK